MEQIALSRGKPLDPSEELRVLECLEGGGLVILPTETVYGLSVDPYDSPNVERLFRIKQRPRGLPVAIAVHDLASLNGIAEVGPTARRLADRFLPGPLTLVVPRGERAPPPPVAGPHSISFRIPDHPVLQQIAATFGPFALTSANRHGHRSPTTLSEALSSLGDEVDLAIDAGPCRWGVESTVVDLTEDTPRIIREGAIGRSSLEPYVDR